MNEALVLRNKKLLNASWIINGLLITSMAFSGKELWFIIMVASILLVATMTSMLLVKKGVNPYIPAAIFTFSVYFIIWLILYIDPSLNKFLFLFAVILIPSIYQDKKIVIFSSVLCMATVFYAFFSFGQEIYGGYDIVPSKSLYFTLATTIIMLLFIYLQSSSTEKLKKMNEQKEKDILFEKSNTEEMLKVVQKNSDDLVEFTKEIEKNINDAKGFSQGIVESSMEMEKSFEKQGQNIQGIVGDISGIKGEVNEIANTSSYIVEKTKDSKELIDESQTKLHDMMNSFGKLKDDFILNERTGEELYSGASEIEMLSVKIEEIAKQTHHLAINASIEATRAGDAGKGFLVVAERVGLLAKDSTEAAHVIKELSSKMQTQTSSNKEFIERSNDEVARSENIIEEFSDTFKEVKHTIEGISGVSDQIIRLSTLVDTVNARIQDTERISNENDKELKDLSENIAQINQTLETLANAVREFNNR